ncbi:MAG: response regulator [Oscillatoriophycideae cyanobacterium NC_groundwater_1537_Pr4_S-0.65um_50_18]|nr:response regulator [Oscillatoriophycideae cyanobacterium NC_groundwater_1537_Pr4_S-0.65um_50_18]
MNQHSILVVDDEPDNFDVIETLLSDCGYELHYAASGYEAIAALETFQPDLILLDIMMPGMDGIEVCQKIKATLKWQAIPIIMVTALNTKEDLARCLQAGADDFISKPMHGLELRARVHSMLRIKQQYDRIQSFSRLQRDTINLLRNNLQALRGNLAASLPHELNTPLNGILGAISTLKENIDDMDSGSIHELLDLSHESACQLESLTQRFLNYLDLELSFNELKNKKETNTTLINKVGCSSALIEHLVAAIAKEMGRSHDLTCQIEVADLAVSHNHLKWIMNELLSNSFKFSQSETPVTVRGECQGKMFHLWISDCGRGMTQEQITSIGAFMQFERQTYQQQGAGLGLKIAQKAVTLYGGRFLVTSTHKKKTAIYLTLPLENSKHLASQSSEKLAVLPLSSDADS